VVQFANMITVSHSANFELLCNGSVLSVIFWLLYDLCCLPSKRTVQCMTYYHQYDIFHLFFVFVWQFVFTDDSFQDQVPVLTAYTGNMTRVFCDQNVSLVEHAVSGVMVFLLTATSGGTRLQCTIECG